jgi:hypothetical protein
MVARRSAKFAIEDVAGNRRFAGALGVTSKFSGQNSLARTSLGGPPPLYSCEPFLTNHFCFLPDIADRRALHTVRSFIKPFCHHL